MAQPKFSNGQKIINLLQTGMRIGGVYTITDMSYSEGRVIVKLAETNMWYYADHFVPSEKFSDVVDDPAKLFPYLRREMNNA